MSDPVRVDYEGPARVVFEEGVFPLIELGTEKQMLEWSSSTNLAEVLHEAVEGERDDVTGSPADRTITRVRISIEVLDPAPVVLPPDPLAVSRGPDSPDEQVK